MYTPSPLILERYAKVLVRFALNSGKGIRKDETVYLVAPESAKPLYMACRREIIQAGGHVISGYAPDSDTSPGSMRDFYETAKPYQLTYFPERYYKGLVETIDHQIALLCDVDLHALSGVDPKKLMARGAALKPWMEWRTEKENKGKLTWTLALFGTEAMAKEAGMDLRHYWNEIIKACFLDEADPIAKWKQVFAELAVLQRKMNALSPRIDRLHVESDDADLWITLGKKRAWMAGSGRNIPSFELFTSPDWRGTEGWIRFNQPLYRYGSLIEGIELAFAKGKVVRATARKNQALLRQMIATKNADRIGEFSLTDRRHSRITKFMAETLFDENMGGPEGNTHIALGNSYRDCYAGNPAGVSKKTWEQLGYNDSSVHTDIISTARRTVTAHLTDGSSRVIYRNGQFTL